MTYWFDPMVGGGGGGIIGGNAATGQPAMSTAQINASMGWNPAAQAQTTNLYGPMGFGGQTAMYAGIGAGYGRQVAPSSPAAVAAYHGGAPQAPAADPWAGTGFDPIQYLHNNPDVAGATGGDPSKAYEHARTFGVSEGRGGTDMFNAPRQYGWDANEGAPYPAAPQTYNRGEFNPYTYGWDHNEGADPYQGQQDFQELWNARGRVYQPPKVESPYGPGGAPTGISPPAQQSSIWDTYGGADVQAAARAAGRSMADFGPEHARNFGLNEGRGIFDKVAYLNKYQDVKDAGVDAYQHYLQFGKNEGREAPTTTNRDVIAGLLSSQAVAGGTPSGTRSPVPDARTYMPPGQFGGYLDHYLWGANSGSLGSGSTFSGYGAQDTSSPMGSGGIGSDARYGAYPVGYSSPTSSGGGIGSDAHYGAYGAALNALRGGQGWTVAQQPQAVSQEMLGNRINQSIYDVGNAGDYYSRSIGGGFGMGMPNQSQGLTGQDLTNPHAYPPGFRVPNSPFGDAASGGGGA